MNLSIDHQTDRSLNQLIDLIIARDLTTIGNRFNNMLQIERTEAIKLITTELKKKSQDDLTWFINNIVQNNIVHQKRRSMFGGYNNYYDKYLKYRSRYFALKNKR